MGGGAKQLNVVMKSYYSSILVSPRNFSDAG
jgi:hypothetical protein